MAKHGLIDRVLQHAGESAQRPCESLVRRGCESKYGAVIPAPADNSKSEISQTSIIAIMGSVIGYTTQMEVGGSYKSGRKDIW